MLLLKGFKFKFKDVRVGDIFALTEKIYLDGMPYINIKIENSVPNAIDNEKSIFPFNAIALEDGRVRTFNDQEHVYVLEKRKLFTQQI